MSGREGVASLIEYTNSPLYKDHQLRSNDKSIRSRKQVELPPRDTGFVGYQNALNDVSATTLSDKLIFNISDPAAYLDGQNTWFEADFKCRAVDVNDVGINAVLENGGIASCFKTVRIFHGSNEIHKFEEYNKLYNAFNLSSNSKEYRDFELASSADSYEDYYSARDQELLKPAVTFTQATATYTNATKSVNLGASGLALSELQVGDLLEFVCMNKVTLSGAVTQAITESALYSVETVVSQARVASITTNAVFILEQPILCNAGGAAAAAYIVSDPPSVVSQTGVDIAAGGIKSIRRLERVQNSTRYRAIQTSSVAGLVSFKCAFQLPLGLLGMDEFLPLPFLPNQITIEITCEHPSLVFVVPSAYAATTNKLGYMFTNPRLIVSLVTPSDTIFSLHDQMYKSTGLVYRMLNYRHQVSQMGLTNQFNFTYQTNLKSVVGVISVVSDLANNSSSGNAAATQSEYSQSNFYKDAMSSFRFKCGGLSFPDYSAVDVDDVGSGKAWKQLQMLLMKAGPPLRGCVNMSSIPSHKWQATDSKKFILGCLMAKDSSYNTGVNLSGNSLEMAIVYTTSLTRARTLHSWLIHDQVMVISKDNGVICYA